MSARLAHKACHFFHPTERAFSPTPPPSWLPLSLNASGIAAVRIPAEIAADLAKSNDLTTPMPQARPCSVPVALSNATLSRHLNIDGIIITKRPCFLGFDGKARIPQLAASTSRHDNEVVVQHGTSMASPAQSTPTWPPHVAAIMHYLSGCQTLPHIAKIDSKQSSATGGHVLRPMDAASRSPGSIKAY